MNVVPARVYLHLVVVVALSANDASARKWTDATGNFSVEADFVELVDGQVALRRTDGRVVRLPLERLSEADQRHVESLAGPAADGPLASDDSTRTVIAEGVGLTPDEALKDAFRAAVRQVVGEVVDAETLVRNDEVVKDQVLTYSDGFVPTHTKVSETNAGGLWRITIRAVVERRKVEMRLRAANVTLKKVDGESMFGNIVSQLENEKDASALLRSTLDGFPENCVTAKIVGEPKIVEKNGQEATLRFEIQVQTDPQAYKSFSARLQKTLQAVSLDQGGFVLPFKRELEPPLRKFEWFRTLDQPSSSLLDNFASWMPKAMTMTARGQRYRTDIVNVMLAMPVARPSDRLQGTFCLLENSVGTVLVDAASREARGEVLLLDKDGQTIHCDAFRLAEPHPDRPKIEYLGSPIAPFAVCFDDRALGFHRGGGSFFIVAPAFFGGQKGEADPAMLRLKPMLTIVRDIGLSLDEIKAIAEAKCRVRFIGPGDSQ